MNAPISQFRSAPSSPRVGMPRGEAKPPAYAARLQQHIALGMTPAEAMAAIERADGHSRGIPPSAQPSNVGGRGNPKPVHTTPLNRRILEWLTRDWCALDEAMVNAIGSRRDNIGTSLRKLRDAGLVDHQFQNGSSKAMWRLKA